MQKPPFFILVTLLIVLYITALLDLPFAFIMSFCGLVYTGVVLFASAVIWWILPQNRKDKFANSKIKYYLFALLMMAIVVLAFLPGRKVITTYYLASASMPLRVFFKISLLLFIVFVTANFLRNKRIKTNIFCIIGYVVFVVFGFFGPAFMNETAKSEPSSNLKGLATLGYLSWAPLGDNEDKSSVTIYDPATSYKGINRYTSMIAPEVFLFDMEGNILHTWILESEKGYPWHYTKMFENGDLIGLCQKKRLLKKIDWNSNTIWELKIRCHHEITVKDDGDIYVLARRGNIVFIKGIPVPVLNDYIAVISADGKLLKEIPILNAIKSMLSLKFVPKIYSHLAKPSNFIDFIKRKLKNEATCEQSSVFDLFHNNTITIADRDIEGVCKKTDLLLSMRNLDTIAILDIDSEEFVWTWGPGQLSGQHHPTFLDNDNILIFDNGSSRDYSRIIELNPKSKQIVWDYVAEPPESFYSLGMGSCQELPNGNILIAEADMGRAFEITRQGKIVWEYYEPHINIKAKKRASFYRLERIVDPDIRQNIESLISESNQN